MVADVQLSGMSVEDDDVFAWLQTLCETAGGPRGNGIAVPSGDVRIASGCSDVLSLVTDTMKVDEVKVEAMATVEKRLMLSQHPYMRLVAQTTHAHVRSFGDGGWMLLYVIARMCRRTQSADDGSAPPALLSLGADVAKHHLRAFFYDAKAVNTLHVASPPCGVDLVAYASPIVSATSTLHMTETDVAHFTSRLVRLYLTTLPAGSDAQATPKTKAPTFRFQKFLVPACDGHATFFRRADIVDGVFVDWGLPLEHTVWARQRRKREGGSAPLRCAVFEHCIEPDIGTNVALSVREGLDTMRVVATDGASHRTAPFQNMARLTARLLELGVEVLLCQKTVHESVKHALCLKGVLTLDRLSIRHIHAVLHTTNATLLSSNEPSSVQRSTLGVVTSIREVEVSGRPHTLIRGPTPFYTFTLYHCFSHVLDELESVSRRVFAALAALLKGVSQAAHPPLHQRVLPGAGVLPLLLALFLQQRVAVQESVSEACVVLPNGAKIGGALLARCHGTTKLLASALKGWATVVIRNDEAFSSVSDRLTQEYGQVFFEDAVRALQAPLLQVLRGNPSRVVPRDGLPRSALQVHGCDAPPGASACQALRTTVGTACKCRSCKGSASEGVPLSFVSRRAGSPADVLEEVCSFDKDGALLNPAAAPGAHGGKLPVVESANEKLHALLRYGVGTLL